MLTSRVYFPSIGSCSSRARTRPGDLGDRADVGTALGVDQHPQDPALELEVVEVEPGLLEEGGRPGAAARPAVDMGSTSSPGTIQG